MRTRSNYEKRVSACLTEKGFETYLPLFVEAHQWKDRKKVVELPIFPGYTFARIAEGNEHRLAVLRTEGTLRILGQGDRIEPIPEEEIESLRKMLSRGSDCLVHPLLREGCWVRVRRGPLKNLEGLLVRAKKQTRLVLSITLLSQSVSTEVDAIDVEYIRSAASTSRRIA